MEGCRGKIYAKIFSNLSLQSLKFLCSDKEQMNLFCDTWKRFKMMLRKCPNHGFEDIAQLSIFLNWWKRPQQPKEHLGPTLYEGKPQERLGPTLHEKQLKERLGPTLHEGHPQERLGQQGPWPRELMFAWRAPTRASRTTRSMTKRVVVPRSPSSVT